MRFRGHCNTRTVKDVAFVGTNEGLVAAGSDDGRMMVWDRLTGECLLWPETLRLDQCCIFQFSNFEAKAFIAPFMNGPLNIVFKSPAEQDSFSQTVKTDFSNSRNTQKTVGNND